MSDESSTDKAGIRPHGWGVIVGTLWVFVAFIGPQFLVSGLVPFIKNLNVGSDTKLFVLEALTELIILAVILLVIKFYSSSLKDIGLLAKLTVRDLGLVLICFPLYLLTSGILSEVIGRLFPGLNLLDQQQIG